MRIGQYVYQSGGAGNNSEKIEDYVQPITYGTPSFNDDIGESSSDDDIIAPEDYGVELYSSLKTDTPYLLSIFIKQRLDAPSNFTLYLSSSDNPELERQYIKKMTVEKANGVPKMKRFDIVFTPFEGYNKIELTRSRTLIDIATKSKCVVVFSDLVEIKNIIKEKSLASGELKKIGVISDPYALMIINGEDIHTDQTGTFELDDEEVPVRSFCIINPSLDNITNYDELSEGVTHIFFDREKERSVPSFQLDYICD